MAAKTPSRIELIKDRYQKLYTEKQMWFSMYQLVGEYVMTRKQNFQVSAQPGEFLTEQLYSSVAPNANQSMASALLGNLWPNGARSIRLVRPRNIPDTKENKEFYETLTDIFIDILDAPETGTAVALQEYMLDQGAFGISGVQVEKTGDLTDPLRVSALNVKYFMIDEDKDGFVDTVFIDKEWTAKQIVDEYGLEAASARVKESYQNLDTQTKYKVVQLIEPRKNSPILPKNNKEYPYASLHFEYESKKILRESGYLQMPAIIARFLKALGEKQGRSPAMFAMPAIMRLNVVWELLMRAGEKKLTPPLYLLDNGTLGSDTIDTSPGAINVFSVSGLGEKAPIGALFDVGQLQDIYPIAETLVEDISKAFFIDRLMDLNNETRMTLGEAQIRDRIRGDGLSSVFKRQETEFFSRFISTAFNMLLEEGLLGVVRGSEAERKILRAGLVPLYIPPDIVKAKERGQKAYTIKYISPASRIMRTEELQGLTQSLDITLAASQGFPEMLDNYDPDVVVKKLNELSGVEEKILRDTKTIKEIREARAQMQQRALQAQEMQVGADVGMKVAQAQSMRQGAISGRPRG
jgi:phenylpyruvate tautomerase PptA (4-oxalocrotonate tautomerase family)